MLADNGSTVAPSQTNHDNQTEESWKIQLENKAAKAGKSKGGIHSVAELHTTIHQWTKRISNKSNKMLKPF